MTSDPASEVIASKIANALFTDAEPSRVAKIAGAGGANLAVSALKPLLGGLWVGGRVTLTPEAICFEPNRLNALAHSGTTSKRIPLARVRAVADRFGWFTRIVDVSADDGTMLTFRCYGAPAFAVKIRDAVSRARSARRDGGPAAVKS